MLSYISHAARLRSDGVGDGWQPAGVPPVTRCRSCERVFLPADALEAPQPPSRWWRAKPVTDFPPPEERDYLEALELGLVRVPDALSFRLAAWRLGNAASDAELPLGPPRSPPALANLEALLTLLSETCPDELLLKAEVARHLGRFELTCELLARLPRARRGERSAQILTSARAGHRGLAWIALESGQPLLTCPWCQQTARGRIWARPPLDPSPRDLILPDDPEPWLVKCPQCAQVAWSAELRASPEESRRHESAAARTGGALSLSGLLGAALCCAPTQARGALAASALALALLAAGLTAWRRRRWPSALRPTEPELLDQIEARSWVCPLEERYLRVAAWRAADARQARAHTGEAPAPDPELEARAQANLLALEPLLGERSDDRLLRTELARQAGRRAEALRLLESAAWPTWELDRVRRLRASVQPDPER